MLAVDERGMGAGVQGSPEAAEGESSRPKPPIRPKPKIIMSTGAPQRHESTNTNPFIPIALPQLPFPPPPPPVPEIPPPIKNLFGGWANHIFGARKAPRNFADASPTEFPPLSAQALDTPPSRDQDQNLFPFAGPGVRRVPPPIGKRHFSADLNPFLSQQNLAQYNERELDAAVSPGGVGVQLRTGLPKVPPG
jgi:hypothetical protein